MELINSFKKYLIRTTKDMVIKNAKEALEKETDRSRYFGELYGSMMLDVDTFWSHINYPPQAILNAGVTNDVLEALEMSKNKHLIPENRRSAVVVANREYFRQNYIEENEYYRQLAGLRPLNSEPILLSKAYLEPCGYTGDKDSVAVDELPEEIAKLLELSGEIERLKETYPKAKYLDHIGNRKIPIVTARRAEDFQLLYFPRLDTAYRFYKDFVHTYEDVRIYYMTRIYNYSISDMYPEYHQFIGFMILMTTIERIINTVFKVVVDRDFYDLESIRIFLSEFNIPFVQLFSIAQQQLLVKNMNILLRQKGDMEVLYNTLELLGYGNFDLYKYILVKQHKLHKENDETQPVPIFYYKTILDENGNEALVLDSERMYDYYFYAVPMDQLDIVLGGPRDDNAYTYSQVTLNDPTWLEDNELAIAKDNMKMNYTETKYAMLTLDYHVQAVSSEITYLTRLILDKKIQTSVITTEMSMFSSDEISIFDVWCTLICLICKRNQLESKIVDTRDLDLVVWGWNFHADFQSIKDMIESKPNIYDQELLKYVKHFVIGSIADIDTAIHSIKEVKRILTATCLHTSDPIVYHANMKLYNTVMLQELDNESILKLKNGSLAETYDQLLRERNPEIMEILDLIETPDDCIDYINYIGTKMATMFPSTEYLSYLNPIDKTLLEAILTILRTFKSFTVDIKDSNTVYRFDDRFTNMMKMMDKSWMEVHLKTAEKALYYNDNIHLFASKVNLEDRLKVLDGLTFEAHTSTHDAIILRDDRFWFFGFVNIQTGDSMHVDDGIRNAHCEIDVSSKMDLHDGFGMWWEDELPDYVRRKLDRLKRR